MKGSVFLLLPMCLALCGSATSFSTDGPQGGTPVSSEQSQGDRTDGSENVVARTDSAASDDPAVADARTDGLSPLGQYIYYDALVVHGPGDDADSFGGIRSAALARCQPPSAGGDEVAYLNAFPDARTTVMQKEEAHSDLSRINVQRAFIEEGKCNLKRPLVREMYGDEFSLQPNQDA